MRQIHRLGDTQAFTGLFGRGRPPVFFHDAPKQGGGLLGLVELARIKVGQMDRRPAPAFGRKPFLKHFFVLQRRRKVIVQVRLVDLGDAQRDVLFARMALEIVAHEPDGVEVVAAGPHVLSFLILRVLHPIEVVVENEIFHPVGKEARDIVANEHGQADQREEQGDAVPHQAAHSRRSLAERGLIPQIAPVSGRRVGHGRGWISGSHLVADRHDVGRDGGWPDGRVRGVVSRIEAPRQRQQTTQQAHV